MVSSFNSSRAAAYAPVSPALHSSCCKSCIKQGSQVLRPWFCCSYEGEHSDSPVCIWKVQTLLHCIIYSKVFLRTISRVHALDRSCHATPCIVLLLAFCGVTG
eukprot:1161138-Pelagomonas_calceolata.AAC.4